MGGKYSVIKDLTRESNSRRNYHDNLHRNYNRTNRSSISDDSSVAPKEGYGSPPPEYDKVFMPDGELPGNDNKPAVSPASEKRVPLYENTAYQKHEADNNLIESSSHKQIDVDVHRSPDQVDTTEQPEQTVDTSEESEQDLLKDIPVESPGELTEDVAESLPEAKIMPQNELETACTELFESEEKENSVSIKKTENNEPEFTIPIQKESLLKEQTCSPDNASANAESGSDDSTTGVKYPTPDESKQLDSEILGHVDKNEDPNDSKLMEEVDAEATKID